MFKLKIINCFLPVAHCVEQINGSLSHRNVSLSFEGVDYRLLWKDNFKEIRNVERNFIYFNTVSYDKTILKKFEIFNIKRIWLQFKQIFLTIVFYNEKVFGFSITFIKIWNDLTSTRNLKRNPVKLKYLVIMIKRNLGCYWM